MQLKKDYYLVSVVVLSYNSSKTIIETLDSILAQTYPKVELIVSDDASQDNSVELCRQWQQQHGERFVRMEILTAEQNQGISANANRGCMASKGQWLKVLAADDLLTPNAVEDVIKYVNSHLGTNIIFSKVKPFGDEETARKWLYYDPGLLLERLTHPQLLIRIFEGNFLPAASAFISKCCYLELGGYDESIPLMEDWPFWIKAICCHRPIAFIDCYTAYYRFCASSVSQGNDWQNDPNSRYYQTQRRAEAYAEEYKKKYSHNLWLYHRSLYEKEHGGSLRWKLIYLFRGLNPFYRENKKLMKIWPQLWAEHLRRNDKVLEETLGKKQ